MGQGSRVRQLGCLIIIGEDRNWRRWDEVWLLWVQHGCSNCYRIGMMTLILKHQKTQSLPASQIQFKKYSLKKPSALGCICYPSKIKVSYNSLQSRTLQSAHTFYVPNKRRQPTNPHPLRHLHNHRPQRAILVHPARHG